MAEFRGAMASILWQFEIAYNEQDKPPVMAQTPTRK